MQKIKSYSFLGFIFVSILGTFLHFAYELFGESPIVGIFSAVNESTAEHLKIFFIPSFIWSIIEYSALGREIPSYWRIKSIGISLGIIFITAFFYTYRGILGYNIGFLNILDFFLGAGVASLYQYNKFKAHSSAPSSRLPLLYLIGLLAAFIIFTFLPPPIGLFYSP